MKNNRYYTGSTENLERRLIEHNTKYTKLTKPFELVHFEKFNTGSEAVKREMYLKTGRGRDELQSILDDKNNY